MKSINSELIRFYVNDNFYTISEELIESFPIANNYLYVLLTKYKNKSIGIEVNSDAIVINLPEDAQIDFKLIIDIYSNPKKTLYEHLQIESLFTYIKKLESRSSGYELKINPQYISIRKENFKMMFKALKFFGIEELFYSKQIDFVPEDIIKRINDNLLQTTYKVYSGGYLYVDKFSDAMKNLGLLMSGSFLLKNVLNEYWESNDIDFYVNEGALLNRLQYIVNKYDYKLREICPTLIKYNWQFPTENIKDNNKLKKIHNNIFEEITSIITTLFGGEKKLIYEPEENMDGGYDINNGLKYVIKFSWFGMNIDVCVLSFTPQYFIGSFDFDFNKAYYDGYTIHHMKLKSLLTRTSTNNYHISGYDSHSVKFYDHSKRIEKYWFRGFYIIPNTKTYYKNKNRNSVR